MSALFWIAIAFGLSGLASLIFVIALMRAAHQADEVNRIFRRGVWSPRPAPPAPAAPPERARRTESRRRAPRLSVNPALLVEPRPARKFKLAR